MDVTAGGVDPVHVTPGGLVFGVVHRTVLDDGDPINRPLLVRVDFATATVHLVPEGHTGMVEGQFPWVLHTQTGRFVALINIPGDCLNLRDAPGLGAPLISCVPHGAVVSPDGERASADGVTWQAIRTAYGPVGWVNQAYLDTGGR